LASNLSTTNVQNGTLDLSAIGSSDVDVKAAFGEPEKTTPRGGIASDVRWSYPHQGVDVDLVAIRNQNAPHAYQILVYSVTP
jgi:hypothetical protein